MMSGHRKADLVVLAATSVIGSVCLAPAALSAAPTWNGRYAVTFAGTQKTGTSVAADKPEGNSVVDYGFSSSCSTGTCIATVFDAPPPDHLHLEWVSVGTNHHLAMGLSTARRDSRI
jgi:hypothetical protein